jgi:hypothetical protein
LRRSQFGHNELPNVLFYSAKRRLQNLGAHGNGVNDYLDASHRYSEYLPRAAAMSA